MKNATNYAMKVMHHGKQAIQGLWQFVLFKNLLWFYLLIMQLYLINKNRQCHIKSQHKGVKYIQSKHDGEQSSGRNI